MDAAITVRLAREADFAVLAPVVAALPVFAPYKFESAALQKRWCEALAQQGHIEVANLGDRPVGLCWYLPRGAFGAGAYLRFLCVVPDAQGLGAGAKLLSAYEKACQNAPGGLFVMTSHHNEAAAAFYGDHGYNKVGELPEFATGGVTELIFWKPRLAKNSPPARATR